MPGIPELSGQELKTFIYLIDKVDSLQEQMDNVSWEMGSLRKKQKEMQEIQNTVREMKNAFDGLISRLDMAKYKLQNISGETTQTKKQRKKTWGKHRTEYPKTVEQSQMVWVMKIPEGEERKEWKKYLKQWCLRISPKLMLDTKS